MLNMILSDDTPRSKVLSGLLIALIVLLFINPFIFPSNAALLVGIQISVFLVLAASFDMLLGYTAVLSFAHSMFFGIGAYFVAITFERAGASFGTFLMATVGGLVAAGILALIIGLFSLRVRAIFFALVTLAFAVGFEATVNKMTWLTHGEEGVSYKTVEVFQNSYKPSKEKVTAFRTDRFISDLFTADEMRESKKYFKKFKFSGKYISYYMLLIFSVVMFLLMLRMVNSPFGRVLQALRENEFRAEAIGYKVVIYRTTAVVIASCIATLTGCVYALSTEFVSPVETLHLTVMINILLMVVIGGMGTMYGAIIGAAVLAMANIYLSPFMSTLATTLIENDMGWLAPMFEGRWFMWLGVLFVLVVYFFPNGVVGKLRKEGATVGGH